MPRGVIASRTAALREGSLPRRSAQREGGPIDRAAREARKRTWLVEVRMFVKDRWIEPGQLRVRAGSVAGAAAVAVREARRACLKPRTRVGQVSLTITPVPASARRHSS